MHRCACLITPLLLLVACAPSRFVKPLDKGQQAVEISLGGPIVSTDAATIPLPFLTATYGRGFDSTFTGIEDRFLSITTQGEVVFNNYRGTYKEAHRILNADHGSVPNTMGYQNYLQAVGSFIVW